MYAKHSVAKLKLCRYTIGWPLWDILFAILGACADMMSFDALILNMIMKMWFSHIFLPPGWSKNLKIAKMLKIHFHKFCFFTFYFVSAMVVLDSWVVSQIWLDSDSNESSQSWVGPSEMSQSRVRVQNLSWAKSWSTYMKVT